MANPTSRRNVLTDDDIREILLSDEPLLRLAERFGVTASVIGGIRRRSSFRSLRIARELGLIPRHVAVRGWATTGEVVTATAGMVRR
jgi:hypothetical protein